MQTLIVLSLTGVFVFKRLFKGTLFDRKGGQLASETAALSKVCPFCLQLNPKKFKIELKKKIYQQQFV